MILPEPVNDARRALRAAQLMLGGAVVIVAGFSVGASLNDPPFAAPLFYLGISIVGFGVVMGTAHAGRSRDYEQKQGLHRPTNWQSNESKGNGLQEQEE